MKIALFLRLYRKIATGQWIEAQLLGTCGKMPVPVAMNNVF
jgi:hypothetical protein